MSDKDNFDFESNDFDPLYFFYKDSSNGKPDLNFNVEKINKNNIEFKDVFKKNKMVTDPKIFSELFESFDSFMSDLSKKIKKPVDKNFEKIKNMEEKKSLNININFKVDADIATQLIQKLAKIDFPSMKKNLDIMAIQKRLVHISDAVDNLLEFIESRRKSR